MLVENITYLATFIATSGLAVIGILVTYQQFQADKNFEFQTLVYQQIFLFSFFIYSIWGNLALRQLIADLNVNNEISEKVSFFLPLPGIPFLMVSAFMLLKFGYNVNGWRFSRKWIYIYFAGFLIFFSSAIYLFHANVIAVDSNPDTYLLRLFVSFNIFIHVLFFVPFWKPNLNIPSYFDKEIMNKYIGIYSTGTLIYSMALWFAVDMGYIGTAFSFLLLFSTNAFLPTCIKLVKPVAAEETNDKPDNFELFCSEYHISKREAEIIHEICDGKTNKAIAEKLFITLQTVKDHTHRIYTKTNVKNRVQLSKLVLEKDLL